MVYTGMHPVMSSHREFNTGDNHSMYTTRNELK